MAINSRAAQPTRSGFTIGRKANTRIGHFMAYMLIFIFLVISLMPMAWMISTSLQTQDQLRISVPVQWVPKPATFDNYVVGWKADKWMLYFRNTVFFAVASTIAIVVSTTVVGYAFARMEFRGREALMMLNIALMLLPGQVTMVPRFIMFAKMQLVGTWIPVIVPFFFATTPYYTFLMRQFFRSVPMELSDAARIDGCTELGIFWRIVLPLTKPAIAVMAAGNITWAWNALLTSLIYLKDNQHRTLVLALQGFIGVRGQVGWGPLMAMSFVIAVPVMGVYWFLQRYFTEAFILSGLKG